ncbi:MAG: hypothetical protein HC771_25145 [Synechococcales cyanobacterium CRU_2_2]|nr:hypothetical protein [Synechococcales cyanobacterium CRU_2_2]
MKSTQILAISALGMLLAAGCTKAETPEAAAEKPVAVVNGTPISRDVWNLYIKTRHAGKSAGDLTAEEQTAALDELIGMYAGAQEADKQKLGTGERDHELQIGGVIYSDSADKAARFVMDVTQKPTNKRFTMTEMALYSVKKGKVRIFNLINISIDLSRSKRRSTRIDAKHKNCIFMPRLDVLQFSKLDIERFNGLHILRS